MVDSYSWGSGSCNCGGSGSCNCADLKERYRALYAHSEQLRAILQTVTEDLATALRDRDTAVKKGIELAHALTEVLGLCRKSLRLSRRMTEVDSADGMVGVLTEALHLTEDIDATLQHVEPIILGVTSVEA